MNTLKMDRFRYNSGDMPRFQKWYRLTQNANFKPYRLLCNFLFRRLKKRNFIELSVATKIGGGLYIGHPYAITINPEVIIGENVNIHKGVTIGQENRGMRKGTPVIGNNVWIGINVTIVGAIHISDDVLIAPNSFVNCDVPEHSVVIGNPCTIYHKENATEGYINHIVK